MLLNSTPKVTRVASLTRRTNIVSWTRPLHQESFAANEGNSGMNDFIVSILESHPSTRDAKTYLGTFASKPKQPSLGGARPTLAPTTKNPLNLPPDVLSLLEKQQLHQKAEEEQPNPQQQAALDILDPVQRRTALVKLQGPFTDRQLESICLGLVYLGKLGLVCVIVVARDDWRPGVGGERKQAQEDVLRVAKVLEDQGAKARPILGPAVRLGSKPGETAEATPEDVRATCLAHTLPEDLVPIRSALRAGEIPILPHLALDSFSRMVAVNPNDVVEALMDGMISVGRKPVSGDSSTATEGPPSSTGDGEDVDLTPLRLMIINREGGVPSYARNGLPHLLINLQSEHRHIHDTFDPSWSATHPTSLSNLSLARNCLSKMPPTSSAIVVSHRSPRSLIANLITNKPAQSSSLPAYLLTAGPKKVTPHTPTLIRNGLAMRVVPRERMHELDREKMTRLLEESFRRTLDADAFYGRLEKVLDYAIVAGDYAGACIVTEEPIQASQGGGSLSYLDKFAVHPSHQGDGTVDFLWVALHDESFGLGLDHALNPNEGGKMGVGQGRDLIWRSRSNNPANKWYHERSSGHLRLGAWTMFWCDAESRLREREADLLEGGVGDAMRRLGRKGKGVDGLSFLERGEEGRLAKWGDVVEAIPSSWVPGAK